MLESILRAGSKKKLELSMGSFLGDEADASQAACVVYVEGSKWVPNPGVINKDQ